VVVLNESGLRKVALWHVEAPEAGGILGTSPRAARSAACNLLAHG
jgi:hypothetical protein